MPEKKKTKADKPSRQGKGDKREAPVKLGKAEIETFLSEHPEWKHEDKSFVRTFEFEDFLDGSVAFVQCIAQLAEDADHHPDIDLRWRKVTVRWSTHDANGLTSLDAQLAHACDELASSDAFTGEGEFDPGEEVGKLEVSSATAKALRGRPISG